MKFWELGDRLGELEQSIDGWWGGDEVKDDNLIVKKLRRLLLDLTETEDSKKCAKRGG